MAPVLVSYSPFVILALAGLAAAMGAGGGDGLSALSAISLCAGAMRNVSPPVETDNGRDGLLFTDLDFPHRSRSGHENPFQLGKDTFHLDDVLIIGKIGDGDWFHQIYKEQNLIELATEGSVCVVGDFRLSTGDEVLRGCTLVIVQAFLDEKPYAYAATHVNDPSERKFMRKCLYGKRHTGNSVHEVHGDSIKGALELLRSLIPQNSVHSSSYQAMIIESHPERGKIFKKYLEKVCKVYVPEACYLGLTGIDNFNSTTRSFCRTVFYDGKRVCWVESFYRDTGQEGFRLYSVDKLTWYHRSNLSINPASPEFVRRVSSSVGGPMRHVTEKSMQEQAAREARDENSTMEKFRRTILAIRYVRHEIKNKFFRIAMLFCSYKNTLDERIKRHMEITNIQGNNFIELDTEAVQNQSRILPADYEAKQKEWAEILVTIRAKLHSQKQECRELNLRNIVKDLDRAYAVIINALDIFIPYIETGELNLQPQKTATKRFLQGIIDENEQEGVKTDITVSESCRTIFTDLRLLEIVIQNLYRNGCEAMLGQERPDAVRGAPEFTINVYAEEGFLVMKFSDNGPGIEKADLPCIFDLFWTKGKGSKGTGIGLALVKLAITELGGTIEVESCHQSDYPDTHGTIFTVRLPSGSVGEGATPCNDTWDGGYCPNGQPRDPEKDPPARAAEGKKNRNVPNSPSYGQEGVNTQGHDIPQRNGIYSRRQLKAVIGYMGVSLGTLLECFYNAGTTMVWEGDYILRVEASPELAMKIIKRCWDDREHSEYIDDDDKKGAFPPAAIKALLERTRGPLSECFIQKVEPWTKKTLQILLARAGDYNWIEGIRTGDVPAVEGHYFLGRVNHGGYFTVSLDGGHYVDFHISREFSGYDAYWVEGKGVGAFYVMRFSLEKESSEKENAVVLIAEYGSGEDSFTKKSRRAGECWRPKVMTVAGKDKVLTLPNGLGEGNRIIRELVCCKSGGSWTEAKDMRGYHYLVRVNCAEAGAPMGLGNGEYIYLYVGRKYAEKDIYLNSITVINGKCFLGYAFHGEGKETLYVIATLDNYGPWLKKHSSRGSNAESTVQECWQVVLVGKKERGRPPTKGKKTDRRRLRTDAAHYGDWGRMQAAFERVCDVNGDGFHGFVLDPELVGQPLGPAGAWGRRQFLQTGLPRDPDMDPSARAGNSPHRETSTDRELDFEYALEVPWDELVRKAQAEPEPKTHNQLNLQRNSKAVRQAFLLLARRIIDGPRIGPLSPGELTDGLRRLHRILILSEDESDTQRIYYPSHMYPDAFPEYIRIKMAQEMAGQECCPAAVVGHIGIKLSNCLLISFSELTVRQLLSRIAQFYSEEYRDNGEYVFLYGNNSLFMNMVNGLLRLYRLKGIEHRGIADALLGGGRELVCFRLEREVSAANPLVAAMMESSVEDWLAFAAATPGVREDGPLNNYELVQKIEQADMQALQELIRRTEEGDDEQAVEYCKSVNPQDFIQKICGVDAEWQDIVLAVKLLHLENPAIYALRKTINYKPLIPEIHSNNEDAASALCVIATLQDKAGDVFNKLAEAGIGHAAKYRDRLFAVMDTMLGDGEGSDAEGEESLVSGRSIEPGCTVYYRDPDSGELLPATYEQHLGGGTHLLSRMIDAETYLIETSGKDIQLSKPQEPDPSAKEDEISGSAHRITRTITIRNHRGIHGQPAAAIARLYLMISDRLKVDLYINDGITPSDTINLLALYLRDGDRIKITAEKSEGAASISGEVLIKALDLMERLLSSDSRCLEHPDARLDKKYHELINRFLGENPIRENGFPDGADPKSYNGGYCPDGQPEDEGADTGAGDTDPPAPAAGGKHGTVPEGVEEYADRLMQWANLPAQERDGFSIQPLWNKDSAMLGRPDSSGRIVTLTVEVMERLQSRTYREAIPVELRCRLSAIYFAAAVNKADIPQQARGLLLNPNLAELAPDSSFSGQRESQIAEVRRRAKTDPKINIAQVMEEVLTVGVEMVRYYSHLFRQLPKEIRTTASDDSWCVDVDFAGILCELCDDDSPEIHLRNKRLSLITNLNRVVHTFALGVNRPTIMPERIKEFEKLLGRFPAGTDQRRYAAYLIGQALKELSVLEPENKPRCDGLIQALSEKDREDILWAYNSGSPVPIQVFQPWVRNSEDTVQNPDSSFIQLKTHSCRFDSPKCGDKRYCLEEAGCPYQEENGMMKPDDTGLPAQGTGNGGGEQAAEDKAGINNTKLLDFSFTGEFAYRALTVPELNEIITYGTLHIDEGTCFEKNIGSQVEHYAQAELYSHVIVRIRCTKNCFIHGGACDSLVTACVPHIVQSEDIEIVEDREAKTWLKAEEFKRSIR